MAKRCTNCSKKVWCTCFEEHNDYGVLKFCSKKCMQNWGKENDFDFQEPINHGIFCEHQKGFTTKKIASLQRIAKIWEEIAMQRHVWWLDAKMQLKEQNIDWEYKQLPIQKQIDEIKELFNPPK